jgi:serine/threonine-protein kinase HipA
LEKNQHYRWYHIQRRHFLSTAKGVSFSARESESLLDDMLSRLDGVIVDVSKNIPENFPSLVVESVFDGMRQMRDKLVQE